MVKNGRRITFGMQTDISVESAHSEIAVTTTHIPRKKIGRMTNIGIVIGIIEGGVVTTIDDLQTIVEDSTGAVQTDTIDSIRTNVVMTKVQRTTVVKSHDKNTIKNPRIIGDSIIIGTNKQYQRKLIHLWKWKEVSPAYSISCVNSPVITRRSAHVEKERRQS